MYILYILFINYSNQVNLMLFLTIIICNIITDNHILLKKMLSLD